MDKTTACYCPYEQDLMYAYDSGYMRMSSKHMLFRVFLCVIFCGATVFLILFMHQQHPWSLLHSELYLLNNETIKESKHRPWYFKTGAVFPSPFNETPKLFSNQMESDRIIEQLMYLPENYNDASSEKIILGVNGLSTWGEEEGSEVFQGCPVSRCTLTDNKKKFQNADALLYKDYFIQPPISRPPKQVWILYLLECPYHTGLFQYPKVFNWTATYRRDSDLVTPYEKWAYYDPKVTQKSQSKNYAANKSKKVAWFVSNCAARNTRLQYAYELTKYISVDIYGECGPLKCSRDNKTCFKLLDSDYKFYLAFENSNCRDYITEKLYVNSLQHDILPIVMGARPEDYEKSAPLGSYIHVDDFGSPKELAQYLHKLDQDDALYNTYFQWKGTGEFINTHFWCRLCAMLHAPVIERYYKDINDWWREYGICTDSSWRNQTFVRF